MENKFVFLTPAYNCKDTIKQTLTSFLAQSYENWRAIIIDDVSSDGTGEFVNEIAKKLGIEDKITVVTRTEKYGETRNTVIEVSNIEDDSIVCRVDGGDWLTENDCLYFLNEIYNTHNPAVVWTAHRWEYTSQNISGPLELTEKMTVYDHRWVSSHMKTFRAGKLKKVPIANFKDENGEWIMIACDQAVFLPMMHMANKNKEPLLYLPHVCYHYSINLKIHNLFNNDRSHRQRDSALWIRTRGFLE